jgi:glycosyltransferase involved in cell wall biosynthesis
MKILQLCKKFPYPLKDGESIAVTYLSQALARAGCQLTLLSMNTTKHPFDMATLPADFDHYQAIHLVDIDNRIKVVDAFLNLFSGQSYHIQRYISADFSQKLAELLKANDFDLVQLETLYLAPYISTIRANSKATIVLRSHNVEYEIWKRVMENTGSLAKKWYLGLLTRRLKAFEVARLNEYDLLAAITARDLAFYRHLGCTLPACVVPIGLQMSRYAEILQKKATENSQNQQNQSLTCSFIGSLDWLPNVEGVRWLLDKVWAIVLAKIPTAILHIAGRNTPEWLLDGHWPNVYILGEVDDAAEFIAEHDIMLVPLHSGGGMRVKILEGMALERLIISTTLGIEGIGAVDGHDALIADEPKAFAAQIIRAFTAEKERKTIAANARKFAIQNYDNQRIAEGLLAFYQAQNVVQDSH